MLGRRQINFSTPYLQFDKKFDFLFVYSMMNLCDDLLGLPSCYHGKQRKLFWKSDGILLSDFCGNPARVSVSVLANNALRAHHASAHGGVSTNGLSDILLSFFEMILLSCLK